MRALHKPAVMNTACFLAVFIWIFLYGTSYSAPPERIVSLAPSITEILYDLKLGDRIAAVTTFCDYPPETLNKPKIGGYSNPSIEAIIAMKPDLVVMTDDSNTVGTRDRLTKLGISTYLFRSKRLAELPQGIRDLGGALGIRQRAFKRAATIERELRKYERGIQKSPPPYLGKKAIFVIQPEPLIVAGPKTVIDDVFILLGLQNIAADADSPYPKYSIEEVIRRSPDMIFIGQGPMTGEGSKNLLRRLESLNAVQKGRVYNMSESLYRLTPRVIPGIDEMADYLRKY